MGASPEYFKRSTARFQYIRMALVEHRSSIHAWAKARKAIVRGMMPKLLHRIRFHSRTCASLETLAANKVDVSSLNKFYTPFPKTTSILPETGWRQILFTNVKRKQ